MDSDVLRRKNLGINEQPQVIVSSDLALFTFLEEDQALFSKCDLGNLDASAPFRFYFVKGIVQCPLDVDVRLRVVDALSARFLG